VAAQAVAQALVSSLCGILPHLRIVTGRLSTAIPNSNTNTAAAPQQVGIGYFIINSPSGMYEYEATKRCV
jgi:hypothetical protein